MIIKPKDKDPILEQKFFDFLFPIIFPVESQNKDIMTFCKDKLVDEFKLLTKGSLLEVAISIKKNLPRYDTEGQDFIDGSDAKTASVRWSNSGRSYGAPITSVHAKCGLLRCMVYERMKDKFYFFLIPNDAYSHISSSSNIEIPFNKDTFEPRRDIKSRIINWWDFEVDSFESLLLDQPAEVVFADCYLKKLNSSTENNMESLLTY